MNESVPRQDTVVKITLPKDHPVKQHDPMLPGYNFVEKVEIDGKPVIPYHPPNKGTVRELWHEVPEDKLPETGEK